MTKEEIEVYEKLIEANTLFTRELTKLKEKQIDLEKTILDVKGLTLNLYKFMKETGEGNFTHILEATLKKEREIWISKMEEDISNVEDIINNKYRPVNVMIKAIGAITALIGAVIALLLIFGGK